ncbi:mCG146030, isoform CRA_a, partial [Mus musculus]
ASSEHTVPRQIGQQGGQCPHYEISTPDSWLLPGATDAGGWGAEGRAPESPGWDCGYIVGCPRVRWLLLCSMEDGEAAATITGPVMRRVASRPGLEGSTLSCFSLGKRRVGDRSSPSANSSCMAPIRQSSTDPSIPFLVVFGSEVGLQVG